MGKAIRKSLRIRSGKVVPLKADWLEIVNHRGLHIEANTFRTVTGPGVYVFQRGERVLYVGKGNNVLHRASDNWHHKRDKFWEEFDSVTFIPSPSEEAASAAECELIRLFEPTYNEAMNPARAIAVNA